jgi:cell division septum initiation protein DivIVA
MITPAEMMADAFRRSNAAQQEIKELKQENNALEQEIKELKQEKNALEQENKDLKQRVGTLEISQEGQSVVAPEGEVSEEPVTPPSVHGILGHQLRQHKGPFSSDEYVALENYVDMKELHSQLLRGDRSAGQVDSCAICRGSIEEADSYEPCNCDDDYYWVCHSCGVLLSKDRAEADKQFLLHLEIINKKQ